jgi:hypothetical protein
VAGIHDQSNRNSQSVNHFLIHLADVEELSKVSFSSTSEEEVAGWDNGKRLHL